MRTNRLPLLSQVQYQIIFAAALLQILFFPSHSALGDTSQPSTPMITYEQEAFSSRSLIFLNNPEFLWAHGGICDLADEFIHSERRACGKSLFRIHSLGVGPYRAWWEHRNMMPFAIRSSLLLQNTGNGEAVIKFEGDALEANSFRNGGSEFVQMFNSLLSTKIIHLRPGEKILLGETSKKWISPGHFFAGVSDFSVVQGQISLDEIVYRRNPAHILSTVDDSQRTTWGVHESLVYKGLSKTSEVILKGASFTITEQTPPGALPVSYHMTDFSEGDHSSGFCEKNRTPVCSGSALKRREVPSVMTSWVTHIAPDPMDPNPKRKRAIMSDLIALVIPGSTENCPSEWPLNITQASHNCVFMSPYYHWFLLDFDHWRLPNWGNWGVHYKHPFRVQNTSLTDKVIGLRIKADGKSPLAYRGSGVSSTWKQAFLDPKKQKSGHNGILIALQTVPSGSTVDLLGEFILSGPGAGTLEHSVEIIE